MMEVEVRVRSEQLACLCERYTQFVNVSLHSVAMGALSSVFVDVDGESDSIIVNSAAVTLFSPLPCQSTRAVYFPFCLKLP